MPDITMCCNKECVNKDNCYRFMATPGERQSFSDFENGCNKDNDYKMQIKMSKEEI